MATRDLARRPATRLRAVIRDSKRRPCPIGWIDEVVPRNLRGPAREPESLLEGSQRLGRALPVYPFAIPRIDVEDFGRDRRHAPAFPKFVCETELHLTMPGRQKIMEAFTVFSRKASR